MLGHEEEMPSREEGNTRHGSPLILEQRRPNTQEWGCPNLRTMRRPMAWSNGSGRDSWRAGMELARQVFLSHREDLGVRGRSRRP